MRFSENRALAWAVLAAAVIFSISFSGRGALKSTRVELEQIFYEGSEGDGLCINRDLGVRAQEAYTLAAIARKYLGEDAPQVTGVEEASRRLSEGQLISERAQANAALTSAVEDLYAALGECTLSESDQISARSAYREIQSRADTISRDAYNARASAFNRTIEKFPASLLASLTGVEPLELFD